MSVIYQGHSTFSTTVPRGALVAVGVSFAKMISNADLRDKFVVMYLTYISSDLQCYAYPCEQGGVKNITMCGGGSGGGPQT